jgi:mannose-6-phosphate isomerase-like protein (cupin superfamily)
VSGLTQERFEHGDRLHAGAVRQPIVTIRPAGNTHPSMSCNWYSVAPGKRVSLHMHTAKSELWFVFSGEGIVTLDGERLPVNGGTSIYTPRETPHALENTGSVPLVFVGVAHPPSTVDPATGRVIGTIELEEPERSY